jgi:hypothetical protein
MWNGSLHAGTARFLFKQKFCFIRPNLWMTFFSLFWSKLWMTYFDESGDTLPPPFNLLPNPMSWYGKLKGIFCSSEENDKSKFNRSSTKVGWRDKTNISTDLFLILHFFKCFCWFYGNIAYPPSSINAYIFARNLFAIYNVQYFSTETSNTFWTGQLLYCRDPVSCLALWYI